MISLLLVTALTLGMQSPKGHQLADSMMTAVTRVVLNVSCKPHSHMTDATRRFLRGKDIPQTGEKW